MLDCLVECERKRVRIVFVYFKPMQRFKNLHVGDMTAYGLTSNNSASKRILDPLEMINAAFRNAIVLNVIDSNQVYNR